ncbi:MAG TPA: hypothetical protein VH142_16710 [Polyangiaceae bacterium]|jgi:hypothetical protein|nr:hypothetical protein [Polyangiaceae bacterium]
MKPEEEIPTNALRIVEKLGLGPEMVRDVLSCFRAADPNFSRFLWAAGNDAELDRSELLARCSAIFFQYVAVQLSDDLSDGDCTYLPDPQREGPALLLVLQHLFYLAAANAGVPTAVLADAAGRFLFVGAAQVREVRLDEWNLERARAAAAGLNAKQFAAYLHILWWGTPLASRAESIGQDLGVAVHVASDARSGDRRFSSLSTRDRRALVRWAALAAKKLERHNLGSLARVLPTIHAALRAAD